MTLSRAHCKKASQDQIQDMATAGTNNMLSPKLEQELVSKRDKRLFAPHHVVLAMLVFLYGGWGAAKQVTESGAFLAFLISTLH